MLRTIFENLYCRLPLVRECREIRASLSRIEKALKAGQTIRLLDFDLRDHPRYGDPRRLLRYHSQVCSQNGEDGIIHEIFRRIGTTTKIFVEVGVGDGCENNTAFLLSQGWTGFWIDGVQRFHGSFGKQGRPPEGLPQVSRHVLRPGRTLPRYSSNSVCQRSLTCCHSISTRTPITRGKAFAVFGPVLS